MVFPSFSENPHVIYETVNIRELGQNDPHQSTNVAPEFTKPTGMVLNWNKPLGVSNAVNGSDLSDWHGLKLEQASWCFKCCQWFRSFRLTDLPITLSQIHFRDKFMSWQFSYDFFHIWHRFCIEFSDFIHFPEVDAEPHRTVLFRNKDYWWRIRRDRLTIKSRLNQSFLEFMPPWRHVS